MNKFSKIRYILNVISKIRCKISVFCRLKRLAPHLILLIIFCQIIPYSNTISAQNKNTPLEKSKWKKLTENKDFQENPLPEDKPMRITPPDWKIPTISLGTLGQYLLIGVLIILLIFIVLRLFGIGWQNKRIKEIKPSVNIADMEKNIHDIDLWGLLQNALDKLDYRLAIRVYFLIVIKTLSDKDWIKWKKEKTNRAYLNEMRNNKDFETFRQLTLAFERIWYGNLSIQESQYQQLHQYYEQFIQQLDTTAAKSYRS